MKEEKKEKNEEKKRREEKACSLFARTQPHLISYTCIKEKHLFYIFALLIYTLFSL